MTAAPGSALDRATVTFLRDLIRTLTMGPPKGIQDRRSADRRPYLTTVTTIPISPKTGHLMRSRESMSYALDMFAVGRATAAA